MTCYLILLDTDKMTTNSISTNLGKILGYITDCEGNYNYWEAYIKISTIIRRHPSSNQLILQSNGILVYGGDVCDRGTGDIRLLQDLINLYENYPNQVYFICGNRDCNKLRLKFELNENIVKLTYPKVYWIDPKEPLSQANALGIDNKICNLEDRLKWVSLSVDLIDY
jgi:hypothetical protein